MAGPIINSYGSHCSRGVAAEAAPFPIFGTLYQSALDRIAMHVSQLLDEFAITVNVEVIKPLHPEGIRIENRTWTAHFCLGLEVAYRAKLPARECDLDCSNHYRTVRDIRLRDQQMDMLGHDDVSTDCEAVLRSHLLKHIQKEIAPLRGGEERFPSVTAERDEVESAGVVVSFQTPGHDARVFPCHRKSL